LTGTSNKVLEPASAVLAVGTERTFFTTHGPEHLGGASALEVLGAGVDRADALVTQTNHLSTQAGVLN
jgi:hypothetical protein